MNARRQFCFNHSSSGEDIFLYTLSNSAGTEVMISNYGAIITSFKCRKKDGSFNDIVLGFDTMEEYLSPLYLGSYPWMGCAIGRTANRIKNGLIHLGGKEIQLTQNKGRDQLHGGFAGFDKKVWKEISFSNYHLELGYMSADGEEGFPGNLEVRIRFQLDETNELSYEFHATTDQLTVVNLTHHSYFNLDDEKGTVDLHKVMIHGTQILEQDEGLVANGGLIDVNDTIFDLRSYREIGKKWEEKEIYDQSYVVGEKSTEPRLVAEARSDNSGTHLKILSTEPIVHFYSGKWFPTIKGKGGADYGPCSGFCLETHVHPNAINIPTFPDTTLRPSDTYYQKTVYQLEFF